MAQVYEFFCKKGLTNKRCDVGYGLTNKLMSAGRPSGGPKMVKKH